LVARSAGPRLLLRVQGGKLIGEELEKGGKANSLLQRGTGDVKGVGGKKKLRIGYRGRETQESRFLPLIG